MVGSIHRLGHGTMSTMLKSLIEITRDLSREVNKLSFSEPVAYVYNPLDYAWKSHRSFLKKYGEGKGRVLLIGMNPGPWGMAQTGVPFGEVANVRDFLGIEEVVKQPDFVHPKRPVQGFNCPRSEVSGRRVWEWAKDRYGTAGNFFSQFFVINYCPLCFMEEGGKNRTPDKLKSEEREATFKLCDTALRKFVKVLDPSKIVGIGRFAQQRSIETLSRGDVETILHPSPASPIANRGWAPQIEGQFEAMGVHIP